MPGHRPSGGAADTVFDGLPASYAAIARALRTLVRTEAPGLRETVKWNNPFWVGRRDVFCLQCYDAHVNFGVMRGAELAADHPVLEGTGRSMRHVKVATVAAARHAALVAVVRAAVRLDAGPPAPTRPKADTVNGRRKGGA